MGISPSRRRRSDTGGASVVEYIILVGIIALLSVAAWRKFHDSVTAAIGREAYQVKTLEGSDTQVGSSATPVALSGKGAAGPVGVSGPASGESASSGAQAVAPAVTGPTDPGGALALDWPSRAAASSPADLRGGASGSWGPTSGVSGSWDLTPQERADALVAGVLKIMCPQDKAFLQALKARGVTITAYDRIYFDDPYYDGKVWTTKRFEAAGTTGSTDISVIAKSDAQNAATIYHEGVHTGQPDAMPWRDKEYDAYTKGEQWAIDHGQPPMHGAGFRTTDKSGKVVVNTAAIHAFVDKNYPGVSTKSVGGAKEQVIAQTPDGQAVVKRADGSTYQRAPKAGDSYSGPQVTEPVGGIPIDMNKLQCS